MLEREVTYAPQREAAEKLEREKAERERAIREGLGSVEEPDPIA
jgi:hypothetical protein